MVMRLIGSSKCWKEPHSTKHDPRKGRTNQIYQNSSDSIRETASARGYTASAREAGRALGRNGRALGSKASARVKRASARIELWCKTQKTGDSRVLIQTQNLRYQRWKLGQTTNQSSQVNTYTHYKRVIKYKSPYLKPFEANPPSFLKLSDLEKRGSLRGLPKLKWRGKHLNEAPNV